MRRSLLSIIILFLCAPVFAAVPATLIQSPTTANISVTTVSNTVDITIVEEDGTVTSYGDGGTPYTSVTATSIGSSTAFTFIIPHQADQPFNLIMSDTTTAYVDDSFNSLEYLQTQMLKSNRDSMILGTDGTTQYSLQLPDGIWLEPEDYLELDFTTRDSASATPCAWINVRNDSNGSVASYSAYTGAVGSFALTRATDTGIDGNSVYHARLRLPIVAADVASVTGPARIIVDASTTVGMKTIASTIKIIDSQSVASDSDFDSLASDIDTLTGDLKFMTMTNGYTAYANVDMDCVTAGTPVHLKGHAGWQYVPAGRPIFTIDDNRDRTTGATSTLEIVCWDYTTNSDGLNVPSHKRYLYGTPTYDAQGAPLTMDETGCVRNEGDLTVQGLIVRMPDGTEYTGGS